MNNQTRRKVARNTEIFGCALLVCFLLLWIITLLIAIFCTINGFEAIQNDAPVRNIVLWFVYPVVWIIGQLTYSRR